MSELIDDFPHHGEHLDNDDAQAELTISLLAVFVSFLACAVLGLTLAVYI